MPDQDADHLLEQEIPALRRYAYAMTRDQDAADDLVQDCLERALSRWHVRRSSGALRPWLFAILRNLYVNAYHARRRRGVHVALEDGDALLSTPADQQVRLETRDALSVLSLLSEEQASLLLLVGVEDLSYDEAAAVLGIPAGTVMSRLSRARARLRALVAAGPAPRLRSVK
jgi:RNA polymerase sigma factor (sigma-70 family)